MNFESNEWPVNWQPINCFQGLAGFPLLNSFLSLIHLQSLTNLPSKSARLVQQARFPLFSQFPQSKIQKIIFSLIGEESSQKILKLSDFLFSSYQREEIGHLNLNPCASTAQYIDSDRGAECPPLEKCNALKQRFVGMHNWLSIDLNSGISLIIRE